MVHLKIANELLGTSKQDNSSRMLVYTLVFIRKAVARCALYSNEVTL